MIAANNRRDIIGDVFLDKAARLEEIDDETNYQAMLRLSEVAKNNHVIYIYMLQKIEDKIVFLVSSATDEEIANEDIMVNYLDPYEDAPQAVYDAFESKQTTTEEYTDQ